jgi:hypothetical protein
VINAQQLLVDLTRQLKGLEADLRQRIAEQPGLNGSLRDEWQAALDAKRCAETFETWADQVITQAGVHWLLSCVFLRFIEDNQLVDRPWLAGTPESGRLALARDRHEAYFRTHPLQSDRDYLLAAFREAGTLPGLHTFFDETHNPVFRLGISGDAAMALRQFWQQVDTDTGLLLRDFTDPAWNTRFLGDLYQDLSEATRKRYALLQTPEFVEEFILDRTLTPAIHTFGFREVRMIDPTCGSGHFLLGGFARLVNEWQRNEPARNPRDIAQKALDAVAGVDLNPFAVAISRFRLLLAALEIAGVRRLSEAPAFQIHVAIGDSLLHGTRFGLTGTQSLLGGDQYIGTGLAHAFASEDLSKVGEILGRQYHAVVGNPPYILVRDAALNAAYRSRYASCHRQYSLGAPFTERFFDLAVTGAANSEAGFVGLITASSFMNCLYGAKLIEEVLPRLDLTHIVDTAGAFIPGHGTSTVILFGRHRPEVGDTVRSVMGIKSEPAQPLDASKGLVWNAIADQIDLPGSESEYISVSDTPRSTFRKFPWSTGGGGLAELRKVLGHGRKPVSHFPVDAGYSVTTGDDNALLLTKDAARRALGLGHRSIVEGDEVRHWSIRQNGVVLWPYDEHGADLPAFQQSAHADFLWPYRTNLKDRKAFGVPIEEKGLRWWDLREVYRNRLKPARTITFGEIATHNHFSVAGGSSVFNRTAPVIQLASNCSDEEFFGLVGVLNSSICALLLRGVCRPKEGSGIGRGIQNEAWEKRFAFSVTNVVTLPLPSQRPHEVATKIHECARQLAAESPAALLENLERGRVPSRSDIDAASRLFVEIRGRMISWQEELDWKCYGLYGLLPEGEKPADLESEAPPELTLGERAFEIVLARRVATGDESTSWFERHGSTPITELPAHWPADYRAVVERRIALIESDRNIGLIERPEFKRRWNAPAWGDLEKAALRDWLLNRLEQPAFWPAGTDTPPQLTSTAKLAERAQADADLLQVAALYTGHADFDIAQLVAELVASEAVPLLPVQRYTEDGLRKRAQWQDTWALQRREDEIDAEIDRQEEARRQELMAIVTKTSDGAQPGGDALAWVRQELDKTFVPLRKDRKAQEVGPIPVPPKYKSSDFLKADFWRLRGGLDVPKERFVSFPGAERGADGSLVIAWAGWNHLQLATALAAYYVDMKDTEGWEPARLQPLLAGLLELVPWLEQWHNDLDPVFGERMGTYYKGFVAEEARTLGFTLDDLRAWKPAVVAAKRGRKKANREA